MQQTPEQIRNEQRAEGRNRSTLTVRQGYNRGEGKSNGQHQQTAKKPFVAKGHDLILKNMQDDPKAKIKVTLAGDGAEVVGRLIARDKFTITVLTADGRRRTLYKHAIEGFEPVIESEQTTVQ